jgi:hypothetical protein
MTRLALLTAVALAMTVLPSRSALPPPGAPVEIIRYRPATPTFEDRAARSNAEAVRRLLSSPTPRELRDMAVSTGQSSEHPKSR